MNRSSCPSISELERLLDSSSEEDAPIDLESHLGDCQQCQDKFHELASGAIWDSWITSIVEYDPDQSREFRLQNLNSPCFPRIPGYEIVEEIARGGMGVVYRANHLALNRPVALKTLLPGCIPAPEKFTRFQTEALAVAALTHPGIVQIYEVGLYEGLPYLALELADGGSLASVAKRQLLSCRQAAQLVACLANTMQFVHQRGIVHRDLKPANILLGWIDDTDNDTNEYPFPWKGVCKVTDFGLAKQMTVESDTRSGELFGTPAYVSPEQASGEPGWSSPATDIYSLGVILYELLTGRVPFQGATVVETFHQIVHNEPSFPRHLNPAVHRDLEAICLKCIEKRAADRYFSAQEIADDLSRYLAGKPVSASRIGPGGALLRWGHRNPIVATLLTTVVLTTSTSAVTSTWLWQRAVAEQAVAKQLARAKEQESQKRAISLRIALESIEGLLDVSEFTPRPIRWQSYDRKQRDAFRRAVDLYDSLLALEGESASNELRLAQVLRALAAAEESLGRQKEASEARQRYERIVSGLHARFPQNSETLSELAWILNRRALAQRFAGHNVDAEVNYVRAAGFLRDTIAAEPKQPSHQYRLGLVLNNLAVMYSRLQRWPEASSKFLEGNGVWRQLVSDFPEQRSLRRFYALNIHLHGDMLFSQGRWFEAQILMADAGEIRFALVNEEPNNREFRYDLAQSHLGMARLAVATGQSIVALEELDRSQAIFAELIDQHGELGKFRSGVTAVRELRMRLLGVFEL